MNLDETMVADDESFDLGLSTEYLEALARGETPMLDNGVMADAQLGINLTEKLEPQIAAADPSIDTYTPENIDEMDKDNFGWSIKQYMNHRKWLIAEFATNEARLRMLLASKERREEKK